MTFQGKRVLIIGGTSGIGLAVGKAVANRGGTPILVSRRQTSVSSALVEVPEAEGRVCDLTDLDSIRALSASDPIDHLVFTAGEALTLVPLADIDRTTADTFFATRFYGAIAVVREVSPRIRPGGSVTLTTGTAGDRPGAGWILGSAVCGAMDSLTRALAVELAPLRVNAISPGVIRSPLWSELSSEDREGMYDAMKSSLPLRRVGEVEDVALAYIYAMEQKHGTGAIVRVDGGTVLV